MKHQARLSKLEAKRRAANKGMTFVCSQDYSNPNMYHSEGGSTYSSAELDRLSAAGVRVVRICYADEPLRDGTERYTWEPAGALVR